MVAIRAIKLKIFILITLLDHKIHTTTISLQMQQPDFSVLSISYQFHAIEGTSIITLFDLYIQVCFIWNWLDDRFEFISILFCPLFFSIFPELIHGWNFHRSYQILSSKNNRVYAGTNVMHSKNKIKHFGNKISSKDFEVPYFHAFRAES